MRVDCWRILAGSGTEVKMAASTAAILLTSTERLSQLETVLPPNYFGDFSRWSWMKVCS